MSEPGATFSIVVTVAPEQRRADLILSGDMDISVNPVLTDALNRVAAVAPNVTVVDLAAISFAGSVLLNFLARVHPSASPRLRPCRLPSTAGNPQNSRNGNDGVARRNSRRHRAKLLGL
jgi:hypothetical protein